MTAHHLLLVLALVCFVVAALPTGVNVRFEWLGVACIVASWLI